MGCGGSTMPMPAEDVATKMKLDIPAAVAFSVPLTEDEDGVVKKHPPKRLMMMEGQDSPPPLTHEMLQEKMADAEQRRQQILNQRIESAKTLMRPRYNSVNRTNVDDTLEENTHVADEES